MHPETETVLDRRRLRRGVSLWRGLAIAAVALVVGAWGMGSEELMGRVRETVRGRKNGIKYLAARFLFIEAIVEEVPEVAA